jgi:hypothetical protein
MSLLGFDALGRLAVGQLPAIRYVTLTAQASSYTVTGIAATFTITETPAVGSFALTGAATGQLSMAVAGGVGHFLEEIERQKRLNAITRKIPGPVDRRTVPRFEPLRAPPSAPCRSRARCSGHPEPAHGCEAAAQAEAAKKRRRDEEAVLLLAC